MRGTLAELTAWAQEREVRGEVSLVVAGADPADVDPEDLVAEVRRRVEAGERLKDAAKAVAAAHGVPARGLYDAAVRAPH